MSKSNKEKLKEFFNNFIDIIKKPSTARAIGYYIDRSYTENEVKVELDNVDVVIKRLLFIRKDYSKQLRKERNDAKD